MDRRQSPGYWQTGAAVAGITVAAVAALLMAIIATARSIHGNAERILRVANEVAESTRPFWELGDTNFVADRLLEGARAMRQHAVEVAETLEAGRPGTR